MFRNLKSRKKSPSTPEADSKDATNQLLKFAGSGDMLLQLAIIVRNSARRDHKFFSFLITQVLTRQKTVLTAANDVNIWRTGYFVKSV